MKILEGNPGFVGKFNKVKWQKLILFSILACEGFGGILGGLLLAFNLTSWKTK